MHHIFISYSRSDAPWVRRLVERLEQRNLDLWLDQEDIPVTVPWLAEVEDAIEEAALILRCDSPSFRRSASCSAEIGLAEQAGKPQFVVTVGDDLDACATRVTQTLGGISTARTRRTELRVLARDWDRAGRPGNRLVTAAHRRRLSLGLQIPPPAAETERSFVQASRARSRRRTLATTVLVALIATSVVTTLAFRSAQNQVNSANSQEAARYTQQQNSLDLIDHDPYRGLQVAAQDGGDEAEIHADVVSAALAQPTPDDAFAIPQARKFVSRPVGSEVVVMTASGREWDHPSASADASQPARELAEPVAASAAEPVHGLTTTSDGKAGLVDVDRNGLLWRKISFDAVPMAVAFSPDGRFLAASLGQQVEVADVASGQIRLHMRGATGNLLDVAWSSDGRHVWAVSADEVFSWLTGPAETLIDDPAANFNSVLAAADTDAAWIVGTHTLTEISVATGAVIASKQLPDTLYSAGAAPDGTVALVTGQRHLWVVPLAGSAAARPVNLRGCTLGRPTFSDNNLAYLPCIGGELLALSVPSAKVLTAIPVSETGLFGATAVPHSDLVYAGDQAGFLYAVRGSRVTQLQASECDMDVQRIAVAPDGKAVLPVGSGSGADTCTKVGLRNTSDPADPASWTWNAVIEPQELSIYGSAVSFSPHGGSFAVGYSDGTITMHPTVNITPSITVDTADGMIRDMLTLANGDLIAVTNTGMVQKMRLCDSCLSDAALSKVAAAHLNVAIHLGLAKSTKS